MNAPLKSREIDDYSNEHVKHARHDLTELCKNLKRSLWMPFCACTKLITGALFPEGIVTMKWLL